MHVTGYYKEKVRVRLRGKTNRESKQTRGHWPCTSLDVYEAKFAQFDCRCSWASRYFMYRPIQIEWRDLFNKVIMCIKRPREIILLKNCLKWCLFWLVLRISRCLARFGPFARVIEKLCAVLPNLRCTPTWCWYCFQIPLLKNIWSSSFVLGLSLTKSIEKYTNIYNTKLASLDSS